MKKALPTICILGPTATGKTDLALALAKHIDCEIISVDSSLVYQGMDIGTAKPSPDRLSQVPHHLINICDVTQPYSAAKFQTRARALIPAIHARGRVPLLVGGTMLYYRALLFGLSELPNADPVIRDQLRNRVKTQGLMTLYEELTICDPISANRLKPTDQQRILRALEVYLLTGKPLSEHWKDNQPTVLKVLGQLACFALIPGDRSVLHDRIANRFESMLSDGFVDEVKAFYARSDVHADLPAMRSVGYRQVWQYLAGDLTCDEMIEKAIIATRQLAKRQLTWLRHWPAGSAFIPIAVDKSDDITRNVDFMLEKLI